MKKITIYTEVAYFFALLLLALGTAMVTYGGFGISMVVAPAYILHLYVSQFLPFFSFGMAEYILQAIILVIMMLILRKVRVTYFLSFVVAVFYGFILDGAMMIMSHVPETFVTRIIFYMLGIFVCCAAIALLFNSYLPPEAYEMLVKEVASNFNKPLYAVKRVYDIGSLAASVALSLLLFGELKGIGIGTIVCAVTYGFIIRMFQKIYDKIFLFKDGLKLRRLFQKER